MQPSHDYKSTPADHARAQAILERLEFPGLTGFATLSDDTQLPDPIVVTTKRVLENRTPAMRLACTVVHGWHLKMPDSI